MNETCAPCAHIRRTGQLFASYTTHKTTDGRKPTLGKVPRTPLRAQMSSLATPAQSIYDRLIKIIFQRFGSRREVCRKKPMVVFPRQIPVNSPPVYVCADDRFCVFDDRQGLLDYTRSKPLLVRDIMWFDYRWTNCRPSFVALFRLQAIGRGLRSGPGFRSGIGNIWQKVFSLDGRYPSLN